jgi:C4-dicarboxylate-specific signal transduction histidine kinase
LLSHDSSTDLKENLKIINDEAERAARIVGGLLTFARGQPEQKLPVDINEIIKKTLTLRAYQQKLDNILTITHLAENLPGVMGNAFQLQQAFLNIIVNAEFFMTEAHHRGTLTIVTKNAGIISGFFTDDGTWNLPKNMVRVSVRFLPPGSG